MTKGRAADSAARPFYVFCARTGGLYFAAITAGCGTAPRSPPRWYRGGCRDGRRRHRALWARNSMSLLLEDAVEVCRDAHIRRQLLDGGDGSVGSLRVVHLIDVHHAHGLADGAGSARRPPPCCTPGPPAAGWRRPTPWGVSYRALRPWAMLWTMPRPTLEKPMPAMYWPRAIPSRPSGVFCTAPRSCG